MELRTEKDNKNPISNKLSLLYEKLKNEILIFKSENSQKGYNFDIKLNEKERKIKIFLTLIKNSEINNHNEDIDFIILCEEIYPEKEPKVFCVTNVKYIYNIFNLVYLVFGYN